MLVAGVKHFELAESNMERGAKQRTVRLLHHYHVDAPAERCLCELVKRNALPRSEVSGPKRCSASYYLSVAANLL